MKDENLENIVINLYARGWSIRRISREMKISRGRIRRMLVSNSVYRDTTTGEVKKPKNKRPSKLDPYKTYIGELLEKYSGITGQRIYELLKEKGYDGEITILRDYLKTIRQVVSKTPVKMVETDPGQLAAHDWSDYNITFTTGETRKVTFFSFILCFEIIVPEFCFIFTDPYSFTSSTGCGFQQNRKSNLSGCGNGFIQAGNISIRPGDYLNTCFFYHSFCLGFITHEADGS